MTLTEFENYKLGIDEIDNDHWELFENISVILHQIENNELEKVKETLNKTMAILLTHSYDEIRLMQTMNFPFIRTHIVEHQLMALALETAIRDAEKNNYSNLTENMDQILITHITKYDRLYADYAVAMNSSEQKRNVI